MLARARFPSDTAAAGDQPVYTASNAAYGGRASMASADATDYLKTVAWAATQAQPTTIYCVGRPMNTGRVFDGSSVGNRQAINAQNDHWSFYAGSTVVESPVNPSTRQVACAVFNQASSALYIADSQTPAAIRLTR